MESLTEISIVSIIIVLTVFAFLFAECLEIKPDKDTLLYFLSTVPQVLGAMLALLGVFHVFHLEAYDKRISSYSKQVFDWDNNQKLQEEVNAVIADPKELERIRQKIIDIHISDINYDRQNYYKEIRTLSDDFNRISVKSHYLNTIKRQLQRIERSKDYRYNNKRIITQIFWFVGIIVFLFIAGFFFVQKFTNSTCAYRIVLITGIALAGTSLIIMINYVGFAISNVPDQVQKSFLYIRPLYKFWKWVGIKE